jgi:outer membrane protein OmpA-like peptidoglycan-associated protein
MKTLHLATLAALLLVQPGWAQEAVPSSQEILDALLPTGLDGRRIKGARSLDGKLDSSRGVKVSDGKEVAFINLQIPFEYDSDRLSNDAALTLESLAKALSDEKLKGSKFRIVGHTDARGSEEYNDDLSRRRARSVTDYLAANYSIPADRIEVAAKGKSELLPGIDPEDERNRRVEVQNIGVTE